MNSRKRFTRPPVSATRLSGVAPAASHGARTDRLSSVNSGRGGGSSPSLPSPGNDAAGDKEGEEEEEEEEEEDEEEEEEEEEEEGRGRRCVLPSLVWAL